MDQTQIKAYVEEHYGSLRCETTYGLRRLLIDLPLERYGLEKDSLRHQLLTAQIEMARDELDRRINRKKVPERMTPWNLV
ncbi:hypothetical protein [Sulfuricurvum sp.]|uniref:hypothetical protein n=1 Tax=Sulfuricurvum sp. TaxID=2025608 RepID=UPI0026186C57|nr:hypothetical protein [Sulfuricurvum sp.]MDD3597241.1 hypothetical protein [Sulfuricurvum sp.]